MAIIGSIAIALGLNTAKFQKELKASRTALKRFERRMRRTFRSLKRAVKSAISSIFSFKAALAAAAGAAGFGFLVKSALNSIDALSKVSAKLGATTEGLVSLRLAAEETSGMAAGQFDVALQRMTRRIAEAAAGTGEAQKALKTLGLDVQRLNALTADQKFIEIAEAMQQVEGEANQLALSFKLFDSEGAGLVNTLRLGRDGLEKFRNDAEKLGLVLSSEAAQGAERANNAIDRLGTLLSGLKTQAVAALAPAIEDAVTQFNNWILDISKAEGGINGLGKTISLSILGAIRKVASGMQTLISSFHEAAIALGLLENPHQASIDLLNEEIKRYDEILARYDQLGLKSVDISGHIKARTMLQAEVNKLQSGENQLLTDAIGLLDTMIAKTQERNTIKGQAPKGNGGQIADPFAVDIQSVQSSVQEVQTFVDNARMSDLQKLQAHYENRLFMIESAFQDEIISFSRKEEIIAGLNKQFQMSKTQIEQQEANKQRQIRERNYSNAASILQSLSTLSGTESRKQFERNKKYARAAVIVDTAGGIMKAFNSGLPYPVAVLAAIAVGLRGAAQLATINRTQFGSGGGISVGGGGVGSAPTLPTPAAPTIQEGAQASITINVHPGAVIGIDDFQSAVEEAVRAGSDAERINITVLGERAEVA